MKMHDIRVSALRNLQKRAAFWLLTLVIFTGLKAQPQAQDVSTYIGNGTSGGTEGQGLNAQVANPAGMAIDDAGNIYIAESQGHRIRKIDPLGNTSTFAGNGVAGFVNGVGNQAQFRNPADVVIDSNGDLIVADFGNHVIRKIDILTQNVTTLAGTGAQGGLNGHVASATFRQPSAVALTSDGILYVADRGNHVIRRIQNDTVITLAGATGLMGFANGTGSVARFNGMFGMTIDRYGNLYVAESTNRRIRKITPAGEVTTFAGTGAFGYTNGPGNTATFNNPTDVHFDSDWNLYVTEFHDVRRIDSLANVTLYAGTSGIGGSGYVNGPALSARFANPQGLTVARNGTLYISDVVNQRIRAIAPPCDIDVCTGYVLNFSSTTPGTSYTWDFGDGQSATGPNVTHSFALPGSYFVQLTVSDTAGCDVIDIQTVCVFDPPTVSLNGTNPLCFGDSSGSITSTVTGAPNATFSYLWTPGFVTGANPTGLPAGTYIVSVMDSITFCTASDTVILTDPAELLISATADSNVTCFGLANGGATVSVTGGTPTYTYAWSNGQTAPSAVGLTGGTYTVTVTDINGCSAIDTVIISEPSLLLANAVPDSNVTCFGGSNGQVSVIATGGSPAYSYAWSNGQTTSIVSGLTQGTYFVTVTDLNGCTAVDTVTIIEPSEIKISISLDSVITCFGDSNGQASASVIGGVPGYTFVWSNGQTTGTATGLSAGTYTVTVTDSNGCILLDSITISQPSLLIASAVVDSNVSCFGAASGQATVSATGGTPNYTYLWSSGQTTATASGLSGGTYTVTVTDANGCTAIDTVIITEPVQLLASAVVDSNVSCFGLSDGQATVTGSGGTPTYTFLWSNGQTVPTATGLAAGTYFVTLTDLNGCTAVDSVTITQPSILLASAVVDTNVSCFGQSTGQATVSATGGTPGYTFQWSSGQTTATASGLAAGTYTVTVTDANGCMIIETVNITQPAQLFANATLDSNVTCFGLANGQASVAATGGTPGYSFLWSNGQTTQTAAGLVSGVYFVTVTDANGCTAIDSVEVIEPEELVVTTVVDSNVSCFGGNDGQATTSAFGGSPGYVFQWSSGQTTPTATGLMAGTYTVTVTDQNGCLVVDTVSITQPTQLLATTVVDSNVSCFGLSDGQATVSASGGTPGYTYQWSNNQTTATVIGLAAGTYTVTVTDQNGCFVVDSVTITAPALLVGTTVVDTNVSCFGLSDGQATASATGGTPGYTYLWSNGQTTATATGWAAGSHTVTITDQNGCSVVNSVTITQPTQLTVTITTNGPICPGSSSGTATANPLGGVPGYTYVWSSGGTTQTVTNLVAGTHSVVVTDQNGCTATANTFIGNNAPASATFTISR